MRRAAPGSRARREAVPTCRACEGAPARRGRYFCSQRCAASYAEALLDEAPQAWCPSCEAWQALSSSEEGATPAEALLGDEAMACGHPAAAATFAGATRALRALRLEGDL